jgi:hypothetical protein
VSFFRRTRRLQGRPAVSLPPGVADWGRWIEEHLNGPQDRFPTDFRLGPNLILGVVGATNILGFPSGFSNQATTTFGIWPAIVRGRAYFRFYLSGDAASSGNDAEMRFQTSTVYEAKAGGLGAVDHTLTTAVPMPTAAGALIAPFSPATVWADVRDRDHAFGLWINRTNSVSDKYPGAIRLYRVEAYFVPDY